MTIWNLGEGGLLMNLTPIYKLLSDETRLRIIFLLQQEELCVCELTGLLGQSQPKVSKVLSKLRDMDLVADERKEKFVFYKLKKNNSLLESNMAYIMANIKDYPVFEADLKRLKEKELHIDALVMASIQEVS